MESRHLERASELCAMVGSEDLLTWLELPSTTPPDEARAALKKKRGFLQSMQGNPKFREVARYVIKNYRALDALLEDPAAYAAHSRKRRAKEQLPMLEMAIDSVLVDGVLSESEEVFVRDLAMNLGISSELFDTVFQERCQAAGISPPVSAPPPPPPTGARSVVPGFASPPIPRAKPRRSGAASWDDAFRALLLKVVPPDTRRLVDLAIGQAWGALTLLPEHPQLEYLGLDQDPERLQLAERAMRHVPGGARVALMPGQPQELPIPDAAVDVVLCIRALDRQPDPQRVLAEAARVLRAGGRLVVVEPDHGAPQIWCDGRQLAIEQALTALADAVDAALSEDRPALRAPSVRLGPTLGLRMHEVGLRPAEIHFHGIHHARFQDAEDFAERLTSQVQGLARRAGLDGQSPEVRAAIQAIDAMEAEAGPMPAMCVSLVPDFLVVGIKKDS